MVWGQPLFLTPGRCQTPRRNGRVYVGLGVAGKAVCCLDAATGKELWRIPTPYPVLAPPSLAEGRLLVAMGNGDFTNDANDLKAAQLRRLRQQGLGPAALAQAEKNLGPAGEVWAIDTAAHQVLWRFKADATVLGAPAVAADRAFFASQDGHLYAVSLDGRLLGKWHAASPIVTSPAVTAEHVFFVTKAGRLVCLDRETLQPAWHTALGTEGPFVSSPTVAAGHVYVGTQKDGLLCVGSRSAAKPAWAGRLAGPGKGGSIDASPLPPRGSLLWRYPPAGTPAPAARLTMTAPAAAIGGAIYVPLAAGPRKGLACLRSNPAPRSHGPAEAWFFPTPRGVSLSPAADEDAVFIVDGAAGDPGRHLYCLAADSGAERWRAPVARGASGEFVLTPRGLLIHNDPDTLTCLDAHGRALWRAAGGPVCGVPAWREARAVLARPAPPTLEALDLGTGKRLWETPLDSPPRTGPVIAGNAACLGNARGVAAYRLEDGGKLWQSETGGPQSSPAVGPAFIVYVSDAGNLVLLDAATGSLKAQIAGAVPSVPPLLARGCIVYASAQGLMGYSPATGDSQRWMDTSWLGAISAPPILADSRLYLTTDTMGFVCLGARP